MGADYEQLDAKRIIEKIRESLKPRLHFTPTQASASPPPVGSVSSQPLPPGAGNDPLAQDLSFLHAGSGIYHIPVRTHRKVLGSTVVFAKKLLRRLLTPVLEPQVAYNAVKTRVVQTLKNQVKSLLQAHTASIATLEAELDRRTIAFQAELDRRTIAFQAELESLQGHQRDYAAILDMVTTQMHDLQRHRDITREQIARAERKLRRILYALSSGPRREHELRPEPEPKRRDAESVTEPEFDYAGFEERFRGSEAEIKERQRRHLQYLEGKEPILDLGCGRGEFLELLREAGIKARGVDLSLDMVLLCQEKGLDVAQGDAFFYLNGVSDASLGGIFSGAFIEHFPPKEIIRLTQLCYQKLQPEGVLIFETLNPACLTVFVRSFFLDLSHVWPFHPGSMKYLFETSGFTDIKLDFFSPVDPGLQLPSMRNGNLFGNDTDLYNRAVELVNDLLFGYQDYAIIGRKALVAAQAP